MSFAKWFARYRQLSQGWLSWQQFESTSAGGHFYDPQDYNDGRGTSGQLINSMASDAEHVQ